MTAACMNEGYGLVTGHAYTLLGVVELSNGVRLVKLRNPWGSELYTGPWFDGDPRWTHALKEEAGMVAADDGIFHMPLENFRDTFTTYDVCMYDDNWLRRQYSITGAGQAFIKEIQNSEDQDVVFTLDYQGKRSLPQGCPQDAVYYNLYVQDLQTGAVILQEAAYHALGYGMGQVHLSGKGRYRLLIYNWDDPSVEGNLQVTTYAPLSPVALVDEQ